MCCPKHHAVTSDACTDLHANEQNTGREGERSEQMNMNGKQIYQKHTSFK